MIKFASNKTTCNNFMFKINYTNYHLFSTSFVISPSVRSAAKINLHTAILGLVSLLFKLVLFQMLYIKTITPENPPILIVADDHLLPCFPVSKNQWLEY